MTARYSKVTLTHTLTLTLTLPLPLPLPLPLTLTLTLALITLPLPLPLTQGVWPLGLGRAYLEATARARHTASKPQQPQQACGHQP